MSTSPSLTATIKKKISELLKFKKSWFPNVIKYTWIGFLCILLGLPLYLFTVSIDLFGLYGGMPSLIEVENPENDLSSELISADGVSLGRYFRDNRSQISYQELSEDLTNTLLISEDHRFYNHSGLDFQAYLRVMWGLVTFNLSGGGGGSTITQQLAKNLYTRNKDKSLDGLIAKLGKYPRRIIQKSKEWIISVELEKNFTKEEIIAMYLNTSAFNHNAYGIKIAALTYFKKSADSLNLQESAVLVGMLQNPTLFNPTSRPKNALGKRNQVLYKIYKAGYKIKTREQYDSMAALPLGLDFKVQDDNEGLATYFRDVTKAFLLSYCKARGIDLYNSGLKIYTTIDSRIQKHAEEAVTEHMADLQKRFVEEWKKRGRNPWVDDDTHAEIPNFLNLRIKKSDTYKSLVEKYGEGDDSIKIMLNLKKPMSIFTWAGERDTIFSSMDSLNYYKRFLQTGMMAMDPKIGRAHV